MKKVAVAVSDDTDAVTVDSASGGGGGGGGGQEDKSNETDALAIVAPAMMVSCIFQRKWSELSASERTHAVVEIGEAVKTSQCEAGVMLAQLERAYHEGFLPVPALISLTSAVSCAQTAATGTAVKQHVTRATSTITERIYKLLCAQAEPGTAINQHDFLNGLFRVGEEETESVERTVLVEYVVFDSDHPTVQELAAARKNITAVLRKMKAKGLIDGHTASNATNSVITVRVEKRDRAGGGTSSISNSKDGGGKSSSNSKKDSRAGDGTRRPVLQEDRAAPKKLKPNTPKPARAISSEDEDDDGSGDGAINSEDETDDGSGGGGNQQLQPPSDGVSDFLAKDDYIEVMDCSVPASWYSAMVHKVEVDSKKKNC